MQIPESHLNHLLERLQAHEIMGKSNPPWDADFVRRLIATYGFTHLRSELRKMSTWLYANPEKANKKNYRKFVVNWMNNCNRPMNYGGN